MTAQRIGLVGCSKTKRTTPSPAKDLYISPLFRGRRRFVERTCGQWFVLSAEYGLVEPDRVLAWYDRTLNDASAMEKRAWSERVLRGLDATLGSVAGCVFEIHAGKEYRTFGLEAGLRARGASVVVPTDGLPGLGYQVAFYRRST